MGQTTDVLAAILTCSLYADDALVRAIVDNAHDNPLVIFTPELDPATGASSSALETLETATTQLREIVNSASRALFFVVLMCSSLAFRPCSAVTSSDSRASSHQAHAPRA